MYVSHGKLLHYENVLPFWWTYLRLFVWNIRTIYVEIAIVQFLRDGVEFTFAWPGTQIAPSSSLQQDNLRSRNLILFLVRSRLTILDSVS